MFTLARLELSNITFNSGFKPRNLRFCWVKTRRYSVVILNVFILVLLFFKFPMFCYQHRDDNYWLDLAGLSDAELSRPKTPVKMATSAAGLVPPRSKSAAIFSANAPSYHDSALNRCLLA